MRITARCFARVASGLPVLLLFACPAGAQQPLEVLHTFTGNTDGAGPRATLVQVQGGDQNLYGTTRFGGGGPACDAGCGTVFKVAPDGSGYTILHAFTAGSDGAYPYAGLVKASDGNLYGTTEYGGGGTCAEISTFGCGIIFRIAPDGSSYSILHAFGGFIDGALPHAALVEPKDDSGQPLGIVYGTTALGGTSMFCPSFLGCGTVFSIALDGTRYRVVHSFVDEFGEGKFPEAGVVQAADGLLYGTTSIRGGSRGAVFQMALDGTGYRVQHTFHGGSTDGADPRAALIQLPDTTFYGTTARGGGSGCGGDGCGTVFQMTASGEVSVLHAFTETEDGANPTAALSAASDGHMYGTTLGTGCGVPFGCGSAFRIDVDGTFATVYAFTGAEDGARPWAGLIQAVDTVDTKFYGTTTSGGVDPALGIVFGLTPQE